ncbi:MAG TPA: hypothetical protein VE134_02285, partial [Methanomicrobiales archaeon]|nr:hypothetical protein [Methanomicrobiales archaeon]
RRIGGYTLIFDAFSAYTAQRVKDHPSIQRTGATVKWGIDNPQDLTAWGPAIRLVKEVYFTSNEELERLDAATRMIYRIAGAIPLVRRAQRILVYQVGNE